MSVEYVYNHTEYKYRVIPMSSEKMEGTINEILAELKPQKTRISLTDQEIL